LDQFTVETRAGRTITFTTSDRTRFRSRDGSITRIQDLKVGMFSVVEAVEREGELPLAFVVAVGEPPEGPVDRPEGIRSTGRVTSITENGFSIETPSGETIIMIVDAETRFRSRDDSISSLTDLEPGMMVIIAAKKSEGRLVALLVGVGNPVERGDRQRSPQLVPDKPGEQEPMAS
jgi:hypothetical protein